jgi:hypothetical protein
MATGENMESKSKTTGEDIWNRNGDRRRYGIEKQGNRLGDSYRIAKDWME